VNNNEQRNTIHIVPTAGRRRQGAGRYQGRNHLGYTEADISKHLKKKFETGELDKDVVVSKMEITTPHGAIEGKTQVNETAFYSLDAIIAVGYRVSSARATKFRQWATKILKEFIKKGFVLDEERLKQGNAVFGKDYFRELLEKVRSIRASERRIWQQITDIYAECSFDYDRNSPTTREFYQMVQNRFHYAITGQTAPDGTADVEECSGWASSA